MYFWKRSSISDQTLIHNRNKLNGYSFGHYICLSAYVNDVKGFSSYIFELKNYVFRFKQTHIIQANIRLSNYLHMVNHTSLSTIRTLDQIQAQKKLVSIHFRLGDYEKYLMIRFNLPPISNNYFTRAMQYIYEKDPVIFKNMCNIILFWIIYFCKI